MRKLLFLLFMIPTLCFAAQDIIPEETGTPVEAQAINEEVRKVYAEINIQTNNINSDITALDTRVTALEAGGVSSDKLVKAWVNFDGTTNTGGLCTINDSYNVTSVTDNGVGDYTITWDTDFSNNDYATTISCGPNAGWGTIAVIATGTLRIYTIDIAGSSYDPSNVCVIATGDQ